MAEGVSKTRVGEQAERMSQGRLIPQLMWRGDSGILSSYEKAVRESVLGPVTRQEREDTSSIEEGGELQIRKGLRLGKGGTLQKGKAS